MIKIAYVPQHSNYIPILRGGQRYDFGYSYPLQQLSNEGHFELKVFLENKTLVNFSMKVTFPLFIGYQQDIPNYTHSILAIDEVSKMISKDKIENPLKLFLELYSNNDLCKKLDEYKPDIVISSYALDKMEYNCKKIWICHEYWPETLREYLENKISTDIINTTIEMINKDMVEILSYFDYSITASLRSFSFIENTIKSKRINIYIPEGNSKIEWGKEKYIVLSASAGWFRSKEHLREIYPLIEMLDNRESKNIKLYLHCGHDLGLPKCDVIRNTYSLYDTFSPESVGCGIAPKEYKSADPSKVYMYLSCGIPSFVHENNLENFKDEIGVSAYSAEKAIESIENNIREKESNAILSSFRSNHNLETLKNQWLCFIKEILG